MTPATTATATLSPDVTARASRAPRAAIVFDRLRPPLKVLMALALRSKADERSFLNAAKRVFQRHGINPNPVGAANSKTGVPGTYRPITTEDGWTSCPGTCPYLSDCYAQQYFTGHWQSQASLNLWESLASAAIAIVVARRSETIARLHVAGDLGLNKRSLDHDYVDGLVWLGRYFRRAWGKSPIAYTYTHWPEEKLGDTLLRLRDVGIHVRESDKWGPNGAVVAPHDHIPTLRKATGLDLVLCPAQLTHNHVQCADCRICWEYPNKVIVFEPHGAKRGTVEQTARKVMVDALC